MQRNINMDALRVICVFLVVCIHTLPLSNTFSSFNDYTTLFWQTISRPGLPIFFILSGYFILTRTPSKNPIQETLNRAIKILVPFAIFFGIHYFSISEITGKGLPSIFTYLDLLLYGAHKQFGHLWFVYSILGIYILTPAINRMTYKLDFKDAATVLAVLLMAKSYIVYAPAFARAGFTLPLLSLPSIDTWLIYFISGAVVALSPKKYIRQAVIMFALSMTATALIIPLGQLYKPYDAGLNMYIACISATYLAHSTQIELNSGFTHRFVQAVSRHSYGIYLIHIFVISAAMNVFGIFSRMNSLWIVSAVFVAVLVFLVSFAIASATDRLICERIIRKLSYIVDSVAPQKKSDREQS